MYWDLTTERVLTMEFMEGGQVDDREFMKRHHIAAHEVDMHAGNTITHMDTKANLSHKQRKGGREGLGTLREGGRDTELV